jgi:tetratricopeptide (TPR) repeat protein
MNWAHEPYELLPGSSPLLGERGRDEEEFGFRFMIHGRLQAAWALCLLTGLLPLWLQMDAAARPAVVKEYERTFTTYPYSDPDPVPAQSKIYPYFRYDGFTDIPVQKKWKVVELSNDYLQLLILPEIGGKVWAAIDKTTGQSFIYFNHVVKFRDVSLRGPWTSGGMEANYGIVGHTPNCFSPVDYLARRNPDGSASCIIGALDLLTRSKWRLEINLPADQACFTTRSLWYNATEFEEPYYTWMNVALKASGNLEFIDPGTHYIGHDGVAAPWPMDPENGQDLAWYDQNDFGSYKSYHVLGRLSEFFGGYWHDEDFGMAHYARYADKPGRKLWIWGLSQQGMIWEKLLTDHDGQYVEVQSGRRFNQAMTTSSLTPFKQLGFPAHAADAWTEYWMPVKGTKGFVSASPWGTMNVTRESGGLTIRICPVRARRDKLEVFDGQRLVFAKEVRLRPMQPIEEVVELSSPDRNLRVCLGGHKLEFAPADDTPVSRPLSAPANFDWNSAYGLFLKGKNSALQRDYLTAAEEFQSCLEVDSNYAPALVELAELANRRADYATAREFALRALRVDTYDPGANYQLGLASTGSGRNTDAVEAFSIAALSMGWRSAACLELAKAYFRAQEYERALASAQEALDYNSRNLGALELRACIYRLQGNRKEAETACRKLLELDPLNHFARFEQYLQGKARAEDFTRSIRNELPQETYLELAIWYHKVGLDGDALKVLELAPPTAKVLYWTAYLAQDPRRLARAEAASPAFEFPFRPESIAVFDWAARQSGSWQPKYYLALLRGSLGELGEARKLLLACGDEPRFGPFYAARAQLCETNAVEDLRHAAQLDPGQWRYHAMLARHYLQLGDSTAALAVAAEGAQRFPTNNIIALLHAKTLVLAGHYRAGAGLLDSLDLLPCEGSTEAHELFREAYLMLAVGRMKQGAFTEAARLVETARQWPEHLGVGRPYPEERDERLEDWLSYQCELGCKAPGQAHQALVRVLAWRPQAPARTVGAIVRALALQASGRTEEAQQMLDDWLKAEPASDLARWGREALAGHPAPLPPKLQGNSNAGILSAWLENAH